MLEPNQDISAPKLMGGGGTSAEMRVGTQSRQGFSLRANVRGQTSAEMNVGANHDISFPWLIGGGRTSVVMMVGVQS